MCLTDPEIEYKIMGCYRDTAILLVDSLDTIFYNSALSGLIILLGHVY